MSNATYEINIPVLNSSNRHCGREGGGFRLFEAKCSQNDRYRIVQEQLKGLAEKFKKYFVDNKIDNYDNGIILINQALKKGAITSIQIDSDDPVETSAFVQKYPIFDGFLTNFSYDGGDGKFDKITKITFKTDLSKFAPQSQAPAQATAGGQRHRYKSHRNYKKSNKRVRSAKRASASRKYRRQRK